MKTTKCFVALFSIAMLFAVDSAFAQEATISGWCYGLETSFGVTSENEFPGNFSASFQGMHDLGYGLSFDWIHRRKTLINEYGVSYFEGHDGLLGSAFSGLQLSKFFIPYIGGGLGVKFGDNEKVSFAWKVDGGITSRLSDILYVKAGLTYDNIRERMSISAGVGLKFEKFVTAYYRKADGSTFRRTWTKFLWQDNSTPTRVYEDKFVSQEVVRRYQKNTTSSRYIGPTIISGGVGTYSSSTIISGNNYKMYHYVYDVTVTRKWYTRTWYYKDRAPTTERVHQDEESEVLVDVYGE
jgi:hypothetical protein